jgi:hypothetical protein
VSFRQLEFSRGDRPIAIEQAMLYALKIGSPLDWKTVPNASKQI